LRNNTKIFKHTVLSFLLIGIFYGFFTAKPSDNTPDYKLRYYPVNFKSSLSEKQWRFLYADSVLSTLSLEEKVGQLFMIPAYSNKNELYYEKVTEQVSKYHIGGIIFFQGNPISQVTLTNRFQQAAKIPLLIGIDAEWGLGMRLEQTISFPKAITMGATNDPELIEECAAEIGRQCKRMGIQYNFAPDADVNTNPRNPVINYRSFGSSAKNVSTFARAFVRGLNREHVISSAKHFPGHGNTQEDSHKTLPKLTNTKAQILASESVPFVDLISDNIPSIMVGHLNAPAFDPRPNMPASISEPIIKGFLKGELLYDGLVISDALNMQGLLKSYPTGVAEVKAFKAGNDILLQTADIDIAYYALLDRFKENSLKISDLDYSVRKILMAKKWTGILDEKPIVPVENLISDLNSNYALHLKQKVYDKAVTLLKNVDNLVPISNTKNDKVASLIVGPRTTNEFQKILSLYGTSKNFVLNSASDPKNADALLNELSEFNTVVVSLHQLNNSDKKNFGLDAESLTFVSKLSEKTKVILCAFGNPYSLRLLNNFKTLICAYEDEPSVYQSVANVLFSINEAGGSLPITTKNGEINVQTGLKLPSVNKIGLARAYEVGMDQQKLEKINTLISQSIAEGEFPGCQVLVARKGKVVYYETFGNLRYGQSEPVQWQTIYDLASITKVSATLQSIMLLYEAKKIDLDLTLGHYLPETQQSNKGGITLRELLLHEAGLKSFIPFWTYTKNSYGQLNPELYSGNSNGFPLKVAENLYVKPSIKDSVFKWIIDSPLNESKKHVYSDLGMILLQHVIEKVSGKSLDVFCQENLFEPLGLQNTGFNIYKTKNINQIAPTEVGDEFRNRPLQGTVHDPNAALLGGVAGHAGLFSNAWDLSKILQLNLNGGTYNNRRFFSENTVKLFTSGQSNLSHRGLGWNKPKPEDGNVSEYASAEAFGHTGYTGTVAWVDPKSELVFVFLTNRVYPTVNNKLIKNKTRKRVHDLVYEAILQ
jgi:beta-N-acetylhexosaminidase